MTTLETDTLDKTLKTMVREWTSLFKALKSQIGDDYRASDAPLRLPWKDGKTFPINPWIMHVCLADRLTCITAIFTHLHLDTIQNSPWNAETKTRIEVNLRGILPELEFIGLPSTKFFIETKLDYMSRFTFERFSIDNAFEVVADASEFFHKEIQKLSLFYVTAERCGYFQNATRFGEEFRDRFPLANSEVIEAGNCFAFDRYTATVFHLMRAMEICLRVVETSLTIPSSVGGNPNWGSRLQRIDSHLKANRTNLLNLNFYQQAYTFFLGVKDSLRNPTMHVESNYDEASALRVFALVGAASAHLATQLRE